MTDIRQVSISRPATGDAEWHAVRECFLNGWLTQGPKVAAFEEAFAKRHSVSHALATSNCTTALHLILTALNIGPGDEVIVPAFTWVSTANVVLHCGATPVFVDVDPITFNMIPERVSARVSDRTRAVMPVHLFGLCADVDAISSAAPDIPIIEDAACAAGSAYKGRPAGSLGRAAAFSFHPRKSITTGEGGMITTDDVVVAEQVQMLRNHGASMSEEQRHKGSCPYMLPEFNLLGYNYRMTDLQGAVGSVQLSKLDGFISERQKWAEFYCEELSGIEWLRTPVIPDGYSHSWQAYVCYVDEARAPMPRNHIMEMLQEKGISVRPGTHAVHMLGYYRNKFGIKPDAYPGARDCDRFSMAIPLHNQMTPDDYGYVIEILKGL